MLMLRTRKATLSLVEHLTAWDLHLLMQPRQCSKVDAMLLKGNGKCVAVWDRKTVLNGSFTWWVCLELYPESDDDLGFSVALIVCDFGFLSLVNMLLLTVSKVLPYSSPAFLSLVCLFIFLSSLYHVIGQTGLEWQQIALLYSLPVRGWLLTLPYLSC